MPSVERESVYLLSDIVFTLCDLNQKRTYTHTQAGNCMCFSEVPSAPPRCLCHNDSQ